MRPIPFLVLAATLAYALAAHADILFLDFNGSDNEIAAARRAAEERGEKLVVIKNAEPGKSEEKLTVSKLSAVLDGLEETGVALSTVIISGHDGNGNFFGEGKRGGNVSAEELAAAMQRHPKIRDSVRTMYLWGCYASTPGSLDKNWKGVFPNTAMIAGFSGSAPSQNRSIDIDLLEGLLKDEVRIVHETDEDKLASLLTSFGELAGATPAVMVCDKYTRPGKVQTFAEAMAECSWNPKAEELLKTYNCFLDGQDPACEKIPANTQNNPLRKLYNFAHDREHCFHGGDPRYYSVPSLDTTMRLIFFKNVWANAFKNYGRQFAEIDEALRGLGAPEAALFGDASELARGEVVRKIRAMESFVTEKTESARRSRDDFTGELVNQIRGAVGVLSDFALTSGSSGACVPDNWVEAGSSEPSECADRLIRAKYRVRLAAAEKPVYEKYEAKAKEIREAFARAAGDEANWNAKKAESVLHSELRDQAVQGIEGAQARMTKLELERAANESARLDERIALQENYRKAKIAESPSWDESVEGQTFKEYLNTLKLEKERATAGPVGSGFHGRTSPF